MKQFYVYIHLKPDGTPFYVGKGSSNRAHSFGHRNKYHQRVVAKYGKNNIVIQVFPQPDEATAFRKEVSLIKLFREEGYALCNASDGGEGPSGMVLGPPSKEHRDKNAAAHRGKKQSAEQVERQRQRMLKQVQSAETKAKRAATIKKLWADPEMRQKMCNSMKGRVISDEHKKSISQTKKGVKLSEQVKANIAAGHVGLKHTAEHRARTAASKIGRKRVYQPDGSFKYLYPEN